MMSNNPFKAQKDEGYVSEGANEEYTTAMAASKEIDLGVHIPVTDNPSYLPETFQDLHIHSDSQSQVVTRPAYTRAPSSHVASTLAPKNTLTAQEAHAEAIRRLGKAEHTVKTLKRRGSNESLSSLLSYSIRRPSLSTPTSSTPKSGYGLDALSHVLEDAAQEGNLPLVQAIFALGANPNFRSVNRIKNRRHHALDKAVAGGHVDVIDYLMRQGATFDLGDGKRNDEFDPIDYKLLDTAYAGFLDVTRYLLINQGANPKVSIWPKEYKEMKRTVYRRVEPARVMQRTVLDAIAKWGDQEKDIGLVKTIFDAEGFNSADLAHRVYVDIPYAGDGTRMHQTTHTYSALSLFVKAGWVDAVEYILSLPENVDLGLGGYELEEQVEHEEGQIPSTSTNRTIWPVNALTHATYTQYPAASLKILNLLIQHGFNVEREQQTPDDSAPRSPLSRAIRADAVEAVEAILQARPGLVRKEVSFRLLVRGNGDGGDEGDLEKEYVATPLGAAKMMGCERVLEGLRGWEKRVGT